MKAKLILAAAAVFAAASLAMAVDVGGRMVASLDIVNEDNIPHSVAIDQGNRTIRVYAGPGGTMLPPGQDVAMRVGHGNWRIFGDSGREMNVRFHHGNDYKLHLGPYIQGGIRVLVGTIDDGYSHSSVPLASMRGLPDVNDRPPVPVINPGHHGHFPYDDPYRRHEREERAGQNLGHAIANAFDNLLHHGRPSEPEYIPEGGPSYVQPW